MLSENNIIAIILFGIIVILLLGILHVKRQLKIELSKRVSLEGKYNGSTIRDTSKIKELKSALDENIILLERVQSVSKIGYWKLDPVTEEVSGSNELFNIFCLSRSSATIESFVNTVHPKDRIYVMNDLQQAIEFGVSWNSECRISCCDGSDKWIHMVGGVIKSDDGKIIELMGTVQDITQEKTNQNDKEESRLRFEIMFESIADAVIFVDTDKNIRMINQAFKKLFLYSEEDVLGRSIVALLPSINDQVLSASEQHILTFINKNKYVFDGETSISVMNSSNEKEIGQLIIIKDVSERVRVDVAFRALAASSTNVQFKPFMNDVLEKLCKVYNCEYAFIGRLHDDGEMMHVLAMRAHGEVLYDIHYSIVDTPCHDVVSGETTLIEDSVSIMYPEDKMLVDMSVVSYFGAPLVASDGTTIGLISVMGIKEMKLDAWTEPALGIFATRISQELEREYIVQELQQHRENLDALVKQRTHELTLSKNEAEHANLAKSEFLSHMSHELRTPLNAILGFAQILELDADDFNDTQRTDIKEILNAGKHLLKLINEVLDLAKIEAGKLDIYMQPVSVKETVQQSLSLILPQAEARQIEIIDHVSEDVYIQADQIRFKQIIINLLSNAIKYNQHAGQVTLSSRYIENQYFRISITDTGNGLTTEQMTKLFIAFDRLNADKNVEGAGIGLLICKQLVNLMGGTMGVESTIGEGSTFWVQLNYINNKEVVNG